MGAFGFTSQQMMAMPVALLLASMGSSAFVIGLVLGSRDVLAVLFSIHGGALMDRIGPRRVVQCFSIVAVVLLPLYPAIESYPLLMLTQMAVGISVNMGWLGAQTMIAKMMKGDPTYSGRLTIGTRLCTLTGPGIVGLCWDLFGPWGAFGAMGAWAGAILAATLVLPDAVGEERAPRERPRVSARDLVPAWKDYRDSFLLLKIPMVFYVTFMSMLIVVSQGVQQTFYVVYLKADGYTGTQIGILVAVTAILGSVGGASVGRFMAAIGSARLLFLTSFASVFLICSTPFWGSFVALLIVSALRGGAAGLNQPLMINMVAGAVDGENQGKAVGLRSSFNRLVHVVLPVLMGAVAEVVGIGTSFYVVGGVVLSLTVVLALHARRSPRISWEK